MDFLIDLGLVVGFVLGSASAITMLIQLHRKELEPTERRLLTRAVIAGTISVAIAIAIWFR